MIVLLSILLCAISASCQDAVHVDTLVSASSGILRRPSAIAVGVDGVLYVADTGNHRLIAFDSTGNVLFESSGGGSVGELRWPVDVAVGAAGKVYVADAGNRRIVEYSRLLEWRGEMIIMDTDGQALEPRTVAASPAGDLFVYESDGGELRRYDSFGAVMARVGGQAGTALVSVRDLGLSPDGSVYWTDSRDGKLYHTDALLNTPREYAGHFSDANRVAVTDSTLYVLADSNLIQTRLGSGAEVSKELSIVPFGVLDCDFAARSSGEVFVLDTRRGAVLRVRW